MNTIAKSVKYKNYEYTPEVKSLLEIDLTSNDKKNIHKLFSNYYSLNVERSYEYIIEDLYILCEKQQLPTSEIALIYNVGIRNIQIWLKELGLNRTLKDAISISNKNDQNLKNHNNHNIDSKKQ